MSETKTEIRFSSEIVTLSGQREYSGTSTISLGNGIAYKDGKILRCKDSSYHTALTKIMKLKIFQLRYLTQYGSKKTGNFCVTIPIGVGWRLKEMMWKLKFLLEFLLLQRLRFQLNLWFEALIIRRINYYGY